MQTYNMQVAGIIRRLRRFRYETCKAASSALASVSSADFTRAKSYLEAVEAYVNWVVSTPSLDLPESSPRLIELGDPDKLDMPENESLADMMVMYDLMEIELGNSQSSRMGDSLISHDERRVRALIDKMNLFLDNYVSTILPLDVPESSPKREQTGPGLTGV